MADTPAYIPEYVVTRSRRHLPAYGAGVYWEALCGQQCRSIDARPGGPMVWGSVIPPEAERKANAERHVAMGYQPCKACQQIDADMKRLTADDIATVADMLANHVNVANIARTLGVHKHCIYWTKRWYRYTLSMHTDA